MWPLIMDVHSNGNNTVIVSNNLQAKQTIERCIGIGLQNILKRYQLVSNKEILIEKDEAKFTVILPLSNMN